MPILIVLFLSLVISAVIAYPSPVAMGMVIISHACVFTVLYFRFKKINLWLYSNVQKLIHSKSMDPSPYKELEALSDALLESSEELKSLRQNESFALQVVSQEGLIIGRLSSDLDILWISDGVSAIGGSAEKLKGQSICKLIGKSACAYLLGKVSELEASDSSEGRFELHVKTHIASVWFDCMLSRTHHWIDFSMLDITDKKDQEGVLRLLSTVFTGSHEAIMITDADCKILSTNEAFTRITGFVEKEVLGRNPKIVASGRHSEGFYKKMWESINYQGVWQGEIINKKKNGEAIPAWLTISRITDEEGQLTNYLGIFSDISEIKKAQDKLEYLAHHDVLTGLPNRALLSERFKLMRAQSNRENKKLAVMMLDLDRFKYINDTFGHKAGDILLQEIAVRVQRCLRETDTLSRQGGDEFVVLAGGISTIENAVQIAEKILQEVGNPVQLENNRVTCTFSIGIAMWPDDGDGFNDLLKQGDMAMYVAKKSGKNQVKVYDPSMGEKSAESMQLEMHLKEALSNNEFRLVYQPQIDSLTQELLGFEALLRWENPIMGSIPTTSTIALAEDTGMIKTIGNWVITETCRKIRFFADLGYNMRIACNVSPVQLKQDSFVESVRSQLEIFDINPDLLELELIESVLIDGSDSTIKKLTGLEELGVRLAIDDFGTGYSSMSYLKRMKVDKIKIDKSFIDDIIVDEEGLIIVEAISKMAASLKLDVIAEGVETEQQIDALINIGCTKVQGWMYAQALEESEILGWLESWGVKRSNPKG